MVSRPIAKVQVCWPDPDGVCLEGGCGYCDTPPSGGTTRMVAIGTLRAYARSVGVRRHRDGTVTDYVAAFRYGETDGWPNRAKVMADGTRRDRG